MLFIHVDDDACYIAVVLDCVKLLLTGRSFARLLGLIWQGERTMVVTATECTTHTVSQIASGITASYKVSDRTWLQGPGTRRCDLVVDTGDRLGLPAAEEPKTSFCPFHETFSKSILKGWLWQARRGSYPETDRVKGASELLLW